MSSGTANGVHPLSAVQTWVPFVIFVARTILDNFRFGEHTSEAARFAAPTRVDEIEELLRAVSRNDHARLEPRTRRVRGKAVNVAGACIGIATRYGRF